MALQFDILPAVDGKDVIVGFSGGVDSCVAAFLLMERGFRLTAVTMRLWRGQYRGGERDACFGAHEEEHLAAAADAARALGIPHRVFDLSDEYDRQIIADFRAAHLAGRTPNPCVRCNPIVKFGLLPRLAAEAGIRFDHFATGHYARVEPRADGRFALLRARDHAKDQSYFLHRLSQEQLARQIFPMGGVTKAEAREIARAHNLAAADRPDSQDFYSGDVGELIGAEDRPGNIMDLSGKVLGRHNGFWRYTIGQRKGMGIGGGVPFYVVDRNAQRNEVIVGRADDAVVTSLDMDDVNWVSVAPTSEPVAARLKVRSVGEPKTRAVLAGTHVEFPEGIRGVAPGQSAVLYAADSDEVLCGGFIR